MDTELLILIGVTELFALIIYGIVLSIRKIPQINRIFFFSALAGFVLGIFIVLNEANTGDYFESVKHWPRIDAEVVKSELEGKRAVLPEIFYTYSVDGQSYEGKSNLGTPGFGSRNKRTLTALTILNDYPEGKKIKIAYNPDNPALSTTQFHPPWNYYGKIGFGLFLILCSVLLILFRLPLKRS